MFHKLQKYLLVWGFVNIKSHTNLFIKRSKSELILVLVYMDDIIFTGYNTANLQRFITNLHNKISPKDLGSLHFLGYK